jgi:hypothetical protein
MTPSLRDQSGPAPLLNLESRLATYALASAAASVSILSMSPLANAEVVIHNKTIPVPACGVFQCPVNVDFNSDGIKDFSFTLGTFGYHEFGLARVHARGLTDGALVLGTTQGGYFRPYASALGRGARIGPSANFVGSTKSGGAALEGSERCFEYCDGDYGRHFYGKFAGNHPNRFVGVKFLIKGKTHFGWVRITVITNPNKGLSATITEYGYETIPNRPMLAGVASANAATPEPKNDATAPGMSLGSLALGVEGMNRWRREGDGVSLMN